MLLTPHTLLGIYFALFYQPAFALPAALTSHILFDFFFPHWNPHLFTEMKEKGSLTKKSLLIITVDLVTTIGFTFFFLMRTLPDVSQALVLLGCITLSVLPDLVEVPFYFLQYKPRWMVAMITFQHKYQAKAGVVWGNFTQLSLIGFCLWMLLR
jgi:hypothetical protein